MNSSNISQNLRLAFNASQVACKSLEYETLNYIKTESSSKLITIFLNCSHRGHANSFCLVSTSAHKSHHPRNCSLLLIPFIDITSISECFQWIIDLWLYETLSVISDHMRLLDQDPFLNFTDVSSDISSFWWITKIRLACPPVTHSRLWEPFCISDDKLNMVVCVRKKVKKSWTWL
jgi:hypothetical protein